MSDKPIEGSVQPPQRTDDAAILAAFRGVTDWDDEDVLHYSSCSACDPIGEMPFWCSDSPREKRWQEERPSRPYGEPSRPQPPLPAGLRRASS